MLKLYLAGPDVFLADALVVGARKRLLCREHGFEGLFPIDNDDESGSDAGSIFRSNCALMNIADVGLMNLTPFRSPSADPGTAFELGYLFSLGKIVFGYSSVTDTYHARVERQPGDLALEGVQPRDRNGLTIENFGLTDNLMLVESIEASGGALTAVSERDADGNASIPAFKAFVSSLELMRARLVPPNSEHR
jgi:nucleoside 2-deoxyribosyltransferase